MKIYYYDVVLKEGVDSNDPAETSDIDDVLLTWNSISRESGSFFGIVIGEEDVVQFYWDNPEMVAIDLPDVSRRGSMTKESTFEECSKIVKRICADGSPGEIPGLEFVEW